MSERTAAVTFDIPAELTPAVPRPVPESVSNGRLASKRRNILWGSLTIAGICLLFAPMGFVQTLAIYFVPLGWLMWIGIGIAIIGVLTYFQYQPLKQACEYIESATVALGEVTEIIKEPVLVQDGQVTSLVFKANVVITDPLTGEDETCEVASRPFSPDQSALVDTRFRKGDKVPLVWLPNKFPESVQIYDFLEATNECSLVREDACNPTPLWQSLLLVACLPLMFFVLAWNVYALGKYEPLEFGFSEGLVPFLPGAILGFVALLFGWYLTRKKAADRDRRNETAAAEGAAVELPATQGAIGTWFTRALLGAGSVLLGGMCTMCFAWTLNATLDDSDGEQTPVLITDMIETTHGFVFREYNLHYEFPADGDNERKWMTTPQHLSRFIAPVGRGHSETRTVWLAVGFDH